MQKHARDCQLIAPNAGFKLQRRENNASLGDDKHLVYKRVKLSIAHMAIALRRYRHE